MLLLLHLCTAGGAGDQCLTFDLDTTMALVTGKNVSRTICVYLLQAKRLQKFQWYRNVLLLKEGEGIERLYTADIWVAIHCLLKASGKENYELGFLKKRQGHSLISSVYLFSE